MITNITLENFKCFRKVEVNPRRITVFIGPNGTGKSSVLQAMALLKQSVGGEELKLEGPLVSLRDFGQLLPNFAPNTLLVIGFGGGRVHSISADEYQGSNITYAYNASFRQGRNINSWGNIQFALEQEVYSLERPERDYQNTKRLEFQGDLFSIGIGARIAQVFIIAGVQRGRDFGSSKDTLQDLLSTPTHCLESLKFVPAARGLVRPLYALEREVIDDISLSGGLSRQEQHVASNLAYTRLLENKVSSQLTQVTGVGLRANMVPPQSVSVNSMTPNGDVNIVSEGFGTNALIQLFWQLDMAEKGATVMIEEPEIHLHPKAQAELASLLVEEAQAEDKQIIMTTHSEHILSRLLTLVAERKLAVDELAIYAYEKDDKGECAAEQLEVTEEGKVKGGIKDFFEMEISELDRYIKALQSHL